MKMLYRVMLFFFALTTPVLAAPTAQDFRYCSDIPGPFAAGKLYQVHLTVDIVRQCADGFPDLRLYDRDRGEIPFVVLSDEFPGTTPATYPLEITGYSGDVSKSVITLSLPEQYQPISVLDLDIADKDFKKHVLLAGSRDGKNWQDLAEGDIFDFSSQVDLRKTRIEFTRSANRYYRLTLIDNTSAVRSGHPITLKYEGLDFSADAAAKKDIRLRSVHGRTAVPGERPPVYDEQELKDHSVQVDSDGNTMIALKTSVLLDRLRFEVGNPYYYRVVKVLASDTGKEGSYQLLTRQSIYRFPLSEDKREEQNVIEVRSRRHAFYRIVIENKNSPPLDVQRVTAAWVRKNLYFIALAEADPYALCFGNPGIERPEYDLARFVTTATLPQQHYEIRAAGRLQENTGVVPVTPREKRARIEKLVLTGVVLVLVAGMGFWLYSLMKKAGRGKGA